MHRYGGGPIRLVGRPASPGPAAGDSEVTLYDLDRHGLDRLNSATPGAAEAALLACCGSRRWARHLADLRPYPDLRTLLNTAEHAARALAPADLAEALADETAPSHLLTTPGRADRPGHPGRGDPPGSPTTAAPDATSATSSASAAATEAARSALRQAQAAYEARFGHVFVLCLDGSRPDDALDRALAALRTRLASTPAEEAAVTAAELARLARGRLARLAPDTPPMRPRTVRPCGT
ncbi:2-oxo-4-hydroxy-4-carboxy-5-ureidoimidazoline decarboxylase [Streptomyces hiroshimensis]|uniref:2-oxo-4-hydroxy-4-carboxy-5-ureidoimidazoline decarboxylase n=1 Tax=Streptomyces hiroshimensis TaxID=66424 RepID=A0ABQ2YJZ0_9ACTN|nr:2-oxo-4-hydroxy-4-carboxy-5-ureidoimidazoline decarboxylase [Streptomyces hiroshimensis]GGX85491.1 2-oxo-4-hydroxy-4-carboxy-5-ureidoimidazoline decarboxylase [Streptomyces hiroshimensis]